MARIFISYAREDIALAEEPTTTFLSLDQTCVTQPRRWFDKTDPSTSTHRLPMLLIHQMSIPADRPICSSREPRQQIPPPQMHMP